MAKKIKKLPRISCKCGSEGPVNNRFNACVCIDIDKKSKPKFFDAIAIESVKHGKI